MGTKISVNGQTYDSLEAMPPDVRRLYEETMRRFGPTLADQDGNGIPDIAEGKLTSGFRAIVDSKFVVNGRTYRSVDEMTPEDRHLYERAMSTGAPVSTKGFHFSFGIEPGARDRVDSPVTRGPSSPIEPSPVELGIRVLLVIVALVVIAGLAGWALLGMR